MATRKAKPQPPRTGPGSRTGENARSGPNVPEEARSTEAIKLRLPPAAAAKLRQLGAKHPGGISGAVADWLEAL